MIECYYGCFIDPDEDFHMFWTQRRFDQPEALSSSLMRWLPQLALANARRRDTWPTCSSTTRLVLSGGRTADHVHARDQATWRRQAYPQQGLCRSRRCTVCPPPHEERSRSKIWRRWWTRRSKVCRKCSRWLLWVYFRACSNCAMVSPVA
jgi:hypothetical protein